MEKKIRVLVIAGILLAIGVVFILRFHGNPEILKGTTPVKTAEVAPTGPDCTTSTEVAVMGDGHMQGVFNQGDQFKYVKNWYACNPVQPGDVVYYQFSNQMPPVVRVVRGVSGDRFELIKDTHKKAWDIKINGSLLTYGGGPFFFGVEPPPVLSLFEKEYKGILPKGVVILFSNVPPGDRDSSTFGVVNVADLLGKVIADGYRSDKSVQTASEVQTQKPVSVSAPVPVPMNKGAAGPKKNQVKAESDSDD